MALVETPGLIAHRGNPARFPENTLISIESAVACGARMLEVDVQLTSDRMPVLYHDPDMQRISGVDRQLADTLSTELGDYAASVPDRFADQFAATPIMTLAEYCLWAGAVENLLSFVELKLQSIEYFGAETVVEKVLEHTAALGDRCVIISFHEQAIRLVREHGSHAVGWILPGYSAVTKTAAAAMQPAFLFCKIIRLPEGDGRFWPGDWQWAIYDINDPDAAISMAARGANLIETSHIERMLSDPRLRKHACPG